MTGGEALLARYARRVNEALAEALRMPDAPCADARVPARLAEAMRYSLLADGKRVRPALLLAAVDMLGGDETEAMPLACALEMLHAYSLIHDDLPGMDDDDLRRGRPTNHVVYGVGMALLAGDGLLNLAHEHMLDNALRYPQHLACHLAAIAEISRRAGVTGMIAGQCMDMLSEGTTGEADLLGYIHRHKTADLLTAPLTAAGCLCGVSDQAQRALESFGQCVGLAFQITDDILDVEGDAAALGKQTGVDAQRGKLTWPALHGMAAAKAEAESLRTRAHAALAPFAGRAGDLLAIADALTGRTH